MLRLLFLIIGFLSGNILLAQVSYGVQVASGFSFRKSLPQEGTQLEDLLAIDFFERGKLGYVVGARVELGDGSKVSFQTGINYQNTGYGTRREEFLISTEGTEEVGERTTRFAFQNLEIPLLLNFYQEMTAKGRVYFKLGGTVLYHLKKASTTSVYVAGELREKNDRSLTLGVDSNFGISTGVGYEQQLTDNLRLFVEPIFQYYLRSSHEDSKFKRQPYLLGLSVGLKR